jgi:hypothetical protein
MWYLINRVVIIYTEIWTWILPSHAGITSGLMHVNVLKCSIHIWLMSRFKNEMWTTVICKLWKIRLAFDAFKHELYAINTLKWILYLTENSLSRVMRFSGSWLRVIEYLVNNYSVTRSNSLEDWKDSFTPLRKPSNTHLGFSLTKAYGLFCVEKQLLYDIVRISFSFGIFSVQ